MNKKRIYIAGPVRGCYFPDVVKAFGEARIKLEQSGYETFNPVEHIMKVNGDRHKMGLPQLCDDNAKDRELIMKLLVSELAMCDVIFLLNGWQKSAGVRMELQIALSMGKAITYE